MSKAIIYIVAFGAFIGFAASGDRHPASAPVEVVSSGTREPVVTRVPRAPNGHFYVHATVNGQLVRFMVDTGATSVALTEEDARRVGEAFSKDRYETVGTGASGPVSGQQLRIDSIEIEGKRVSNVRGAVIQGLDISLLGQTYLSRMGSVEMTADEMVIRPAGARRTS